MLWIEDKRGWKLHLSRAKAETLQLYGIIQMPCVCDTDSHCELAMTHRIKSLMTLWAGYLTFLPSYDNKDKLSIKVIQKPRTYGESSGGLVRRRRDWEVIRRSYKRVIRLESLWLAHRVCTLQPLVSGKIHWILMTEKQKWGQSMFWKLVHVTCLGVFQGE